MGVTCGDGDGEERVFDFTVISSVKSWSNWQRILQRVSGKHTGRIQRVRVLYMYSACTAKQHCYVLYMYSECTIQQLCCVLYMYSAFTSKQLCYTPFAVEQYMHCTCIACTAQERIKGVLRDARIQFM